jgi:hypothetical protein
VYPLLGKEAISQLSIVQGKDLQYLSVKSCVGKSDLGTGTHVGGFAVSQDLARLM